MISKNIFHSYDIRGVYPSEIDEQAAYAIARAFVIQQGCDFLIVGKDTRLSSPNIAKAVKKGATDQGARVVDIGDSATPMFYFAVKLFNNKSKGKASGIVVTASHNDREFNGIKMADCTGSPVNWETGIKKTMQIALAEDFPKPRRRGRIERRKFLKDYINFICTAAGHLSGECVVLDTSNGVGGPVFAKILSALGIKAIMLNQKPDGRFPAHPPNPLKPESLKQAMAAVKQSKGRAALGAVIDGDGDRVAFIDDKAAEVPPDNAISIFTEFLTKENPGGSVVYTCNTTRLVSDTAKSNRCKGYISRVGRAYVGEKAKKHKSLFVAEMSGHYFFRELGYIDDALYALLAMLWQLKKNKAKLSELNSLHSKAYVRTGEINITVDDRKKAITALEKKLKDGKRSFIDGISISYPDAWLNARPSNTESLIRLTIEGKNAKAVKSLEKKAREILKG